MVAKNKDLKKNAKKINDRVFRKRAASWCWRVLSRQTSMEKDPCGLLRNDTTQKFGQIKLCTATEKALWKWKCLYAVACDYRVPAHMSLSVKQVSDKSEKVSHNPIIQYHDLTKPTIVIDSRTHAKPTIDHTGSYTIIKKLVQRDQRCKNRTWIDHEKIFPDPAGSRQEI